MKSYSTYLSSLFALCAVAYATDYSSDITESVNLSDGDVANMTASLAIKGEGVVVSAQGSGEEASVAPIVAISKNTTLNVTDGAALNITNGALNFGLDTQTETQQNATLQVSGATQETAGSAYIKDSVINTWSPSSNPSIFKGTGYGTITLDNVTYMPNGYWAAMSFDLAGNSKMILKNGTSFDSSNPKKDRASFVMNLKDSAEFTVEGASAFVPYFYVSSTSTFSGSSKLNVDGENSLFQVNGSHGGLDSNKQYFNFSENASLNLTNLAKFTSSNTTLYTTFAENSSLNISNGAIYDRAGGYSFLTVKDNAAINLNNGSIGANVAVTLEDNASMNIIASSTDIPSNITMLGNSAINANGGSTILVQANAKPVIGLLDDEESSVSLNIYGVSTDEVASSLNIKKGVLTVTDGGNINIYDGAKVVYDTADSAIIEATGNIDGNAGKFVMTGGTITSSNNPAADVNARTFQTSGYGSMTFDGTQISDLGRYRLYLNDESTITFKNGAKLGQSSRSFDIQVHDYAVLNVESGAVIDLKRYGASGCASKFVVDGGVVNINGEGSGIRTSSGSPTIYLEGTGVMNITDGAWLGAASNGATRQWSLKASGDAELNLKDGATWRLSFWNAGTTSEIVTFNDSSILTVDNSTLDAAAYVNTLGYVNFADDSYMIVKNGATIKSDTASDARHTEWNFTESATLSIEGTGNTVNMRTFNASEDTTLQFVADENGISTLTTTETNFTGTIVLDFAGLNLADYAEDQFTIVKSAREWDMSNYICTSEDKSGSVIVDLMREGDTWRIEQVGNDLVMTYIAVPEPATYAMILGALALAFGLMRRRSK